MLAPRDSSDPQRKSQMRDASLYALVIGVVAFVLLLIVMEGWAAPLIFALLIAGMAAVFFLWSSTEGFTRFNDDAARRIEERLPKGRRGAMPGTSGSGPSGDPGGVDPAMPDPDAGPAGESAEEAAEVFTADNTDAAERPDGPLDAQGGSGDPGGVDPVMPDPDAQPAESAAEAAAAFEDGEAEGAEANRDAMAAPGGATPADPIAAERLDASSADGVQEGAAEPLVASADEGHAPRLLTEPEGGAGDDLKQIRGVGPKLEAMLQDLGVWHFHQIASWGPAEVAWVDGRLEGFNGRIERDEWVSQARALRDGETPEGGERDEV